MKSIAVLLVALLAGCAAPTADQGGPPAASSPIAPVCPDQGPTFPFENTRIQEASGIARSLRRECMFFVHDDSGSGPVIYAVDGQGSDVREVWLDAPAMDWEDAASFVLDESPFLLIADTGNNGATRGFVTLLILPEPPLPVGRPAANLSIGDILVVTVRYPAAPFDIEAVAVDADRDEILIVSKGETRLPTDPSGPNQALYTASLSTAMTNYAVTMELQTVIPAIRPGPGDPTTEYNYGLGGGRATAMDIRPDRAELAILTYREILTWPRGPQQTWAEALTGVPRAIAVPDPGKDQMEGLAYAHDGRFLLVTDEQGPDASEMTVVNVEA